MENEIYKPPNSELLNFEDNTLEYPNSWSFIWRYFVWTILFGSIVKYCIDTFLIIDSESYVKLYKWEPTIYNGIIAISFLVISLLYKYHKIRPFFNKNFEIHYLHWYLMNFIMVIVYVIYSFSNIYIAFNLPMPLWVNFDLFGHIGIKIIAIFTGIMVLNEKYDNKNSTIFLSGLTKVIRFNRGIFIEN